MLEGSGKVDDEAARVPNHANSWLRWLSKFHVNAHVVTFGRDVGVFHLRILAERACGRGTYGKEKKMALPGWWHLHLAWKGLLG